MSSPLSRYINPILKGPVAKLSKKTNIASLTTPDNKKKLLDAVKFGHGMWRLQAKFKNLKVMAVSAIGTPGCLDGPPLKSHIIIAPGVAAMTGATKELRNAVATGVSHCFTKWEDAVTVPGLPWYPAFAAWPGPSAPPTPNVPMPLITCVSAKLGMITVSTNLKTAMYSSLPKELKVSKIESFLESIARSVSIYFTTWLPMQQVINVLGYGPVPSFAPPYVPTGPVVMGTNVATPGHLAAGAVPAIIPLPG